MSIIINDPRADISRYPELDKEHPADEKNQFTIGDLHGNALKLIYFLVRQNVIVLDEKNYPELVRIYDKSANSLTQEDLATFDNIVAGITALPVGTVRLIGDELADRGSNDYFTLKVLERLSQLKVPVETLISNHAIEFIDQYETQDEFIAPRLKIDHRGSMDALQKLISKGLVSRAQIDELVHKHIKPSLKAISYTLDKDKITIYSHAGIDISVIQALATKLKTNFSDASAEYLGQSIDFINEKIAEYIQNNTLHTLYLHESIMKGYEGAGLNKNTSPLEFMMWNRFYEGIHRPNNHANGYALEFVHGHDSNERTRGNIFNLDNLLGKNLHSYCGDYSILYSQELPSYKCELKTKILPILEAKEVKEEKQAPISPKTPIVNSFSEEKIKRTEIAEIAEIAKIADTEIANALNALEKNQLNNQDARDLVRKYPHASNDLVLALIALNKSNNYSPENLAVIEKTLQLPLSEDKESYAHNCALLLSDLKDLNMLTEQTRALVSQSAQNRSDILDTLKSLHTKELLTPELCAAVLENSKQAFYIKRLYIDLQLENLLTTETQATLVSKLQHAESLANALHRLKSAYSLDTDNWQLMLNNSEHAAELAHALTYSKEVGILEHLPVLAKNAEHAWSLAYALKELKRENLFNPTNYKIIVEHPKYASGLVSAFSRLKSDGIFTDKTRDLFVYLAQQGVDKNRFDFSLPYLLKKLDEAKLLPLCDVLYHLNNEQIDYLNSTVLQLENSNLFTEKNFRNLTTAFQQQGLSGHDFHDLLDRLKRAGLILKAKQKLSQATFDKLIDCAPLISELKKELNDIVPLPLETFDKVIAEKREKIKSSAMANVSVVDSACGLFAPVVKVSRAETTESKLEIKCQ